HRHPGYYYPVHIRQRLYGLIAVPLVVIIVTVLVLHPAGGSVSVIRLLGALLASLARLAIAYTIALVLAVPLALFIHKSFWTERILLPVFDVLQSVPVLAFFPVIIIFFLNYHLLEGAAIFILVVT